MALGECQFSLVIPKMGLSKLLTALFTTGVAYRLQLGNRHRTGSSSRGGFYLIYLF
jgi:hypothetical protein